MGRSYGVAFAKLGARLSLCDIDEQALAGSVSEIRDIADVEIHAEVVDVADRDAVHAFADASRAALGDAHVVINNAGIAGAVTPVWAIPIEA